MDNIGTPIRSILLTIAFLITLSGCGDARSPTATFDGEVCTYSGPDSVNEGDIEVTFENNSDGIAALVFLLLVDESARADEVARIGSRTSVEGAPPGSAVEFDALVEADPREKAIETVRLTSGTHLVDCVTFTGIAPNEVWRVALVEVDG